MARFMYLFRSNPAGYEGLNKPFVPRRDTPASIQRANRLGIRPVSSQRKTG
jgi:hypothetical protein